jgi:hypothetical protein
LSTLAAISATSLLVSKNIFVDSGAPPALLLAATPDGAAAAAAGEEPAPVPLAKLRATALVPTFVPAAADDEPLSLLALPACVLLL